MGKGGNRNANAVLKLCPENESTKSTTLGEYKTITGT